MNCNSCGRALHGNEEREMGLCSPCAFDWQGDSEDDPDALRAELARLRQLLAEVATKAIRRTPSGMLCVVDDEPTRDIIRRVEEALKPRVNQD